MFLDPELEKTINEVRQRSAQAKKKLFGLVVTLTIVSLVLVLAGFVVLVAGLV